jgi:hypothetical protein
MSTLRAEAARHGCGAFVTRAVAMRLKDVPRSRRDVLGWGKPLFALAIEPHPRTTTKLVTAAGRSSSADLQTGIAASIYLSRHATSDLAG